jgi:hypothetical protein
MCNKVKCAPCVRRLYATVRGCQDTKCPCLPFSSVPTCSRCKKGRKGVSVVRGCARLHHLVPLATGPGNNEIAPNNVNITCHIYLLLIYFKLFYELLVFWDGRRCQGAAIRCCHLTPGLPVIGPACAIENALILSTLPFALICPYVPRHSDARTSYASHKTYHYASTW